MNVPPGQRAILLISPGQRIGLLFPRTEEVVGSNPITSTPRNPVAGDFSRPRVGRESVPVAYAVAYHAPGVGVD